MKKFLVCIVAILLLHLVPMFIIKDMEYLIQLEKIMLMPDFFLIIITFVFVIFEL